MGRPRRHTISFNRPFIAGKELYYIAQAVALGNVSGDGEFTRRCASLLETRFGVSRALMTPSCTASLEMAALLCELGPGDEVIMPSYTFVSTASAVVRSGAVPVFVDIRRDTLNLDETQVEAAITEKTRSIWPIHYAGVAAEMDSLMAIAKKHGLRVVEDAAQAVNAYYKGRALGSIADLGTYSFHETKNYICGEGGALCINDPKLVERAEILRDKGTNRRKFFRGEVDKYTWVDIGSSYVPSEIACAFLYGQLELIDSITERRRAIFETYTRLLGPLADQGLVSLPYTPPPCTNNYHLFYLLLEDAAQRDALMAYLDGRGVNAVIHYVPLHSSPAGLRFARTHGTELPVTDEISGRLLRLPFFHEITTPQQEEVCRHVTDFLTRGGAAADEPAARGRDVG